ncbi:MAG: serine/threonine protein kinase, partial [Anaerolineae bacterium]|nr:serine/threonine protein kinase [Anaerolineae bacterium]
MSNMLFSKYEIHDQLGHGGFGVVYRATDTQLGRVVALKVLHAGLTHGAGAEQIVSRFYREARAVAQLEHPNIVDVYEMGEWQGQYYISMRYVEGLPLSQWLKTYGPMRHNQVANLLRDMAAALAYAHEKGFLHRDVKPSNILIRQRDGAALLTDFGLVKLQTAESAGNNLTDPTSGGWVGTAAYMSPEVWNGLPASPAADAYALACVAYEALTGVTLFNPSGSDNGFKVGKRHEAGADLSAVPEPALRAVLAAGRAKDHEARPSVSALGTQMQAVFH